MQLYTIIGLRRYSFEEQGTGRRVTGRQLYVTAPMDSPDSQGELAEKFSISDQVWERACAQLGQVPTVGDQVYIVLNRFGRFDCFLPVTLFASG